MMDCRDENENEFQRDLMNVKAHVKALLANILPSPRIVEDVTDAGNEQLLFTPLWLGAGHGRTSRVSPGQAPMATGLRLQEKEVLQENYYLLRQG